MRRVALISSAFVAMLAVAALAGGSMARAEAEASRVLDRTFSCAISPRGGLYLVDVRAHSGTRLQGRWVKLAYAGVRSGNFGLATGNMLAWVTAGKPTATTTVEQDFEAFDVKTFGTVGVRRDACRAAAAPIPLTPAGLRGGVAGALGDAYECPASRQVVVRFRALLAATGRLKQGDDFLTAHVPVLGAKLAVRTAAGKPLAYAEVGASGKAKLFAGRGCTVD